jgi:hypothetical protein
LSTTSFVAISSGPYFAACGVLVVTGIAKVRQPQATATALRALIARRVPDATARRVPDATGRVLGGVEIAVGIVAAVVGGATATAVVVLYAAFALVALRLRRTAPGVDCGCVGNRSTPVGRAHLAISAGAAVVAAVYAIGDGAGIASVVRDQPVGGLPFAALVGCCIALVTLLLTATTTTTTTSPEEHAWRH